MIGPLTNLALALRKEPALPGLLDLIVLGGCGNGEGNVTRTAEFNIYADPEAAREVFGFEWSLGITVLPWELLLNHPIPWDDFDRLLYPPGLETGSDRLLYPPGLETGSQVNVDGGSSSADRIRSLLGEACRLEPINRLQLYISLQRRVTSNPNPNWPLGCPM